jgi:hypothetical protein
MKIAPYAEAPLRVASQLHLPMPEGTGYSPVITTC